MSKKWKYNPGSKEAQDHGCKCPVLDNNHGAGWDYSGEVFVISELCPLHNSVFKEKESDDRDEKAT